MIACIESIWKEFCLPLKGFIKKRVSNDQDVEDILQTVFLKIHNSIDNMNESNKIQAWRIYTIAKNTIVDFYRTQKQDLYLECLPESVLCEYQEDMTVNNEIAQCLKAMIQFLPEKYKQALILTEFEHITQKELALRIGLSVSGAKSRVQRARTLLKEMLYNCCYIEKDHRGNIINYQLKNKKCNYC